MKVQIRHNVFETNSSSTHSISVCSKEEFDKWENGELYFDYWKKEFLTYEEVVSSLKEDNSNIDFTDKSEVDDLANEKDFLTSEKYFDDDNLETYTKSYTTKNGDEIVAFGKYGYNG